MLLERFLIALLAIAGPVHALAQAAPLPPATQNPSPMVEETRTHERLMSCDLGGARRSFAGPLGKLVEVWIPDGARRDSFDLVIHYLGAAWLAEQAVARLSVPTVAAVVNIGRGSGIYDRTFSDPAVFDSMLVGITREVRAATGGDPQLRHLTLSGFSAGHGAIRAILRDARHAARVEAILLLDGMHTSYVPEHSLLASGATLDTSNLVEFAAFARAASRGEKRFVVTHSEIFPGTFASTTETADWLLHALGLRRTAVLRWGPHGMQQLSWVRSGGFQLLGFAGNSAPDHIDHLHAMPEMLVPLGAAH